MPLDPRLDRLAQRASRALGPHRVEDAIRKVRAIIGPHDIPQSEAQAQAALDLLRSGEVPSPEQLVALEIVVRLLRPVVFSRGGQLDPLPEDPAHDLHPQELKDLWDRFRVAVAPLLYSIGRIERRDGTHVGTGFLVADGLLATNRHVLAALTTGTEVLGPGVARVVFAREFGRTDAPEHIVPIDGSHPPHPQLDVVVLTLPRLGRPVVTITAAPVAEGDRVAVIGYPADDVVNNPLFLSGVFQGRFGVKRAALGEILDGSVGPALFHDCSTTQGNSGSPVFALGSGQVAGIHRAGFFMYRNEAVGAPALRAYVAAHT